MLEKLVHTLLTPIIIDVSKVVVVQITQNLIKLISVVSKRRQPAISPVIWTLLQAGNWRSLQKLFKKKIHKIRRAVYFQNISANIKSYLQLWSV